MIEITVYRCEICGAQSESSSVIGSCEAQGAHCQYPKGAAIEFYSRTLGERKWFPGIVKRVIFRERTHWPEYRIEIAPDVRKQLGLGVDCEYYETANQQAIRPSQSEPQVAAV